MLSQHSHSVLTNYDSFATTHNYILLIVTRRPTIYTCKYTSTDKYVVRKRIKPGFRRLGTGHNLAGWWGGRNLKF